MLCAKRNLPEELITIIVTNKVALFNIDNLVQGISFSYDLEMKLDPF